MMATLSSIYDVAFSFLAWGIFMTIRMVHIDDNLRDSLDESLDRYDATGKKRPYYLGISISNNKAILLPVRSNCPPGKYTLKLASRHPGKRNHGIDFSKMIIIDKNDLSTKTTSVNGDSMLIADIQNKKSTILQMTRDTISDYKEMVKKSKMGKDLSKTELFLKQRSTLRNYIK